MGAKDLKKLAKDRNLEFIDLKFTDIPGLWQHITIPIAELEEDLFISGIGFDGSSIRGFQPINESDMLIKPEPRTAFVDPFMADPTLSMICNVSDPMTHVPYSRDPRNVAAKAERYLSACGIADQAWFGPEPEFYIFDDIRRAVRDRRSGGHAGELRRHAHEIQVRCEKCSHCPRKAVNSS